MIRTATENDAEALLDIYSYYVKNTAITFEYEVPSVDEFRKRIAAVLRKYPYLVSERNGTIVGYTYASPFKDRKAYDWSVETTIYTDKNFRGKGIGKELYTALEHALALQNIINLNACIAYPIIEDEYLTKKVLSSTRIWDTDMLVNFISADINSADGTTWSGWKNAYPIIRTIR